MTIEGQDTSDHAGLARAPVTSFRRARVTSTDDWLVDEVPVALVFNGISHAVMLASPTDLEDFARGFAFSEGLLSGPKELYGIDVFEVGSGVNRGIEVRLDVAGAAEFRLKERRRNLAGRTGCGLCGTESLDQVLRPLPALTRRIAIAPSAVEAALKGMADAQPIQRASGSAHAAAWCDVDGRVRLVREDVGRHNALDKLIGALATGGVDAVPDPREGFVAITSRASVEMIQKTVMAGVSVLVAVSAPTALAARLADEHGLALAGFARGSDFVAYTFPERLGLATVGVAAA